MEFFGSLWVFVLRVLPCTLFDFMGLLVHWTVACIFVFGRLTIQEVLSVDIQFMSHRYAKLNCWRFRSLSRSIGYMDFNIA